MTGPIGKSGTQTGIPAVGVSRVAPVATPPATSTQVPTRHTTLGVPQLPKHPIVAQASDVALGNWQSLPSAMRDSVRMVGVSLRKNTHYASLHPADALVVRGGVSASELDQQPFVPGHWWGARRSQRDLVLAHLPMLSYSWCSSAEVEARTGIVLSSVGHEALRFLIDHFDANDLTRLQLLDALIPTYEAILTAEDEQRSRRWDDERLQLSEGLRNPELGALLLDIQHEAVRGAARGEAAPWLHHLRPIEAMHRRVMTTVLGADHPRFAAWVYPFSNVMIRNAAVQTLMGQDTMARPIVTSVVNYYHRFVLDGDEIRAALLASRWHPQHFRALLDGVDQHLPRTEDTELASKWWRPNGVRQHMAAFILQDVEDYEALQPYLG